MMRARWWRILVLVLVCGLVALAILVSDEQLPVAPRPPVALPPAVVTLGDSTLSGEGAGNYVAGTNGENGNWCHRSPAAAVYQLHLPPGIAPIDLACSGAQAAQVGSVSDPDAAGTQAQQLGDLARRFRITDVVIQVGANDDPGFGDVVNRCVAAWASHSPDGCAGQLRTEWPQRVAQMQPKVLSAVQAVQAVMARAGYRPGSYSLALQSYASPVAPDVVPALQNLSGCPLLTGDLRWIRDTAVPQLSEALREVARQAHVRFLDLSRAGDGHEACAGGTEWFTRLTVDWESLKDDNRASHATQESFHSNAAGYAEIGRCMGEFLTSLEINAACVADQRGDLQAVSERATTAQSSHP
jgi:lysophospholipase L1-like esterase